MSPEEYARQQVINAIGSAKLDEIDAKVALMIIKAERDRLCEELASHLKSEGDDYDQG